MTTSFQEADIRLSQIETNWRELFSANASQLEANAANWHADDRSLAQRTLLQRYGGAVYRYLLAATHDPHIAEDLSQEFAFRFLRGDFRNAKPEKGRFRNFLKRSLGNLVRDYYRRQRTRPGSLTIEAMQVVSSESDDSLDQCFMQAWRREVIQRVWEALDHQDAESSTSHAFLLRFRCEHSDCTSEELAEQLRKTTGDTVSATTLRQKLLRARQQFCVHMRAEIRKTLGPTANDESVDEELAELGLLKYNVCKYPK